MINIIVAVSTDGFIGKDGKIPWRLKSDVDRFRDVTTNHTVVMGRKTWDSLNPRFKPLPKRRNVVVTRQPGFSAGGAEIVHSIEDALTLTNGDDEVFFIGGEAVYRAVLPFAERLLITRIEKRIEKGDARFPDLDPRSWNLVSKTHGTASGDNECGFDFEEYFPNIPFIELANIRTKAQLEVMRRIRIAGHCPFCPENLSTYHTKPILWKGAYWVLTENAWPYPGADLHYLIILREHKEDAGLIGVAAEHEFFEVVRLCSSGKFLGGGICMRSGSPILSGATVKHLHAQIISLVRGGEPVKFFIGRSRR